MWQVKRRYYPAVEARLKDLLGATRAHVFNHVARKGFLDGTSADVERASHKDEQVWPHLVQSGLPSALCCDNNLYVQGFRHASLLR